jgi:2,3-bisphosphoglycerate-independent phosphoglycerate mutase
MIKPVVLCVLDGWGYRPSGVGNAIYQANTPCMDRLFNTYPHSLLQASEGYVGLPEGQMGNSEVGHTNIGAGRVVLQDLPKINKAIQEDTLRQNPVLLDLVAQLKSTSGVCHVMGLLSPGGVHSQQKHFEYIAKSLADYGVFVVIHGFLDGRDTPPKSAHGNVQSFMDACRSSPNIKFGTYMGRFYAMDRDKRWERIECAYDALVLGKGTRTDNPVAAIEASYGQGVTDEFVMPIVLDDYQGMKDGDAILMINYRNDRAREILTALVDPSFTHFDRKQVIRFVDAVGMVSYSEQLDIYMQALFAPEQITHTLGEVISAAGLKQLRIAETEKYAHVTFFFNGGEEREFSGEHRILVPSPKVATYDLQPQMSAVEVTDRLIEAIDKDIYDLILVNYANTDMVGHTGDEQAAILSVEAVDACMDRLSETVLKRGGALLITADHGNVEVMIDEMTGQPHTAHTLNPVPFIVVAEPFKGKVVKDGLLSDVAPTVLSLMNLPKPVEMTGKSLL